MLCDGECDQKGDRFLEVGSILNSLYNDIWFPSRRHDIPGRQPGFLKMERVMDYIIIGIILIGAVVYLASRFSGILKGKKNLGCSCSGCDKPCSKLEDKTEEDAQ